MESNKEYCYCFQHKFLATQGHNFVTCLKSQLLQIDSKGVQGKRKHQSCALLHLHILSHPQLMFENCSQPLLHDIFCTKEDDMFDNSTDYLTYACKEKDLKKNGSCFSFYWVNYTTQKEFHDLLQEKKIARDVTEFATIFAGVSTYFPIMYNSSHFTRYNRYIYVHRFQMIFLPPSATVVATILHSPRMNEKPQMFLFLCNSNVTISATLVCDGINDCTQGEPLDENLNICKQSLSTLQENVTATKKCSSLLYENASGHCHFYIIQRKNTNIEDKKTMLPDVFTSHQNIHNKYGSLCHSKEKLPCNLCSNSCFAVSEICLFKLANNKLIPCEHGEHMENCKYFDCNLSCKCPGHYCIPWAFVCDSKWDCPFGYDESKLAGCSPKRVCFNLFQCRNSKRCIPISSTCDGSTDCPENDDEHLCLLKDVICPKMCQCLLFAVSCLNVAIYSNIMSDFVPFYAVTCINGRLSSDFMIYSTHIHILVLVNFHLTESCGPVKHIPNLSYLNLTSNELRFVGRGCFVHNGLLKVLSLKSNPIVKIAAGVFSYHLELHVFDLRNSSLSCVSSDLFSHMSMVRIFLMTLNVSSDFDHNAFQNVQIEIVQTNNPVICCILPDETVCHAPNIRHIWTPTHCPNLIPTGILKMLFGANAGVIAVLNVVSNILQKVANKGVDTFNPYTIIVWLVNIAHMSKAVPLLILWIADLIFQEKFALKEKLWRSGLACFVHFFFELCYSLLNSGSLCLFAFSRLMVVWHPMTTKFKTTTFVSKISLGIVLVGTAYSIFVTFLSWYFGDNNSLASSLCSPFVDPSYSAIMIQITIWTISSFQVVAAVFLTVVHIKLFVKMSSQERKMKATRTKKTSISGALVQLVVFTVSSICCWVTSSIVYTISTFVSMYPYALLIWTSVTITPINAVANPLVLIWMSARKLEICRKDRKESPSNTNARGRPWRVSWLQLLQVVLVLVCCALTCIRFERVVYFCKTHQSQIFFSKMLHHSLNPQNAIKFRTVCCKLLSTQMCVDRDFPQFFDTKKTFS